MKFRDLPPIYARLVGFVAGSIAQRLSPWTSAEACPTLRGATEPLERVVAWVAPTPVKAGWELATNRHGKHEPPVLIVPGFVGPSVLLRPLAVFLRLHDRHVKLVRTFPALDGVVNHAQRIADAVERLKAKTGAAQVDLVAHSMGGIAGRYYLLKMGGVANVRRFITIATPHKGTNWAGFVVLGQSMKDLKPGNPLLAELAAAEKIKGVRSINIRAGWDQIVWPREHGMWGADHAHEHELPFAEHWAVQADPRLLALVLTSLEALDEEPIEEEIAQMEREASGA
jgi:pimeloyl-ACP methyl ester carboxylesterase